MLWSWLREKKRRKLRSAPFPEAWLDYLDENVPHYAALSDYEQEVLRQNLRIFIAEKHWEAFGDLVLTEEMQVTVAAQACLLTLNLPECFYPNVRSIFLYPASYRVRTRSVNPAGVVTEGRSYRLGEAWHGGPVVLSWQDVLAGGLDPDDGRNVVFHEFAHKLDMLDGSVDGTPRVHEDSAYGRWYAAMRLEWERLRGERDPDRPGILDPYGAQDAGELFAVATEAFFERPVELRHWHAELYAVLAEYYRQNPAARLDAHATKSPRTVSARGLA